MTLTVALLCGGSNSEHEISCLSTQSVLLAIDDSRYTVIVIGIDRQGQFHLLDAAQPFQHGPDGFPEVDTQAPIIELSPLGFFHKGKNLEIDVAFPLLHGAYGEDGAIQGLLEMMHIRYVGSGLLASAVAMDKEFAKPIFAANGLKVAPGIAFRAEQWSNERADLLARIDTLNYPLFVKPSRSGSSRGTSKVNDEDQLEKAISEALKCDPKVIVEKAIKGRELECAVFQQGSRLIASPVGEIKVGEGFEFYDFTAKYSAGGMELVEPMDLSDELLSSIRDSAIRAFQALDCEGLARVDFFLQDDGTVIINEVNTMPGFTSTSVYPKLMERAGVNYTVLISALIEEANARPSHILR